MKEEYLKKEFWDNAREGYDYWIVPIGNYVDEVEPEFHRIEQDHYCYDKVYVDERGQFWPSDDENTAFVVYKRPESFPEDGDEDNSENYTPKVGEECFALYNSIRDEYRKVRLIAVDDGEYLYRWLQLPGEIGINEGLNDYQSGKPFFKPLPKEPTMEERLLDKWRMQSLDYCHDTEKSMYHLKSVFAFINKFYRIEEK